MKNIPAAEWGREVRAHLSNDKRYLVGVSGGRDSVVLLHWLLAQGYGRLIVCHFEHGLRGRAGKADARFVERLARRHGLSFVLGSAEVASLASLRKQSIETVARHERLAFFTRVARRRRCPTIFLGHHADDQVETFLLNLLRGAAGRGLGAMRERAAFGALELVRPFLAVWRAEIDRYVEEHRLRFREDASNAELGARRNRVRHKIIPWLEKEMGRELRAPIWRTASLLAEEEDLIETLIPLALTSGEELSVAELRRLPLPWQRRVIHRWLRGREVAGVGYEVIENVRGLLEPGQRTAKINLPRARHIRRRAGKIFLE